MTHTYAILKISPAAYQEIRSKLEAAGYSDQFHGEDNGERIDMHGIAIQAEPAPGRETGLGRLGLYFSLASLAALMMLWLAKPG